MPVDSSKLDLEGAKGSKFPHMIEPEWNSCVVSGASEQSRPRSLRLAVAATFDQFKYEIFIKTCEN